ncbi:MAG TPA: DUF3341 domain-containing protein [Longimicrobiales bacterium]
MAEWIAEPRMLAEFDSMDDVIAAAARLRARGYEALEVDSPYPVTDADTLLGLRRPRLPVAVLAAGLIGAILTLAVQWYANAWDYPLNVGGRPLLSVPAWIPITFELGVLSAAFAAVGGLLAAAGLPRLWHPAFEVDAFDRVTTDRFFIIVDAADPRFDRVRTRHDLEALGAVRVLELGAPA